MPLNSTRLKQSIKQAYLLAAAVGTNREDGLEVFAEALADAIIDEVKQLKINYTNGLAAGANPVVGTLNHTVS